MENGCTHKVVVKTKTFDIVSANTEFYHDINGKLYYTFDKFICLRDLDGFKKWFSDCDGTYYMMKMSQ